MPATSPDASGTSKTPPARPAARSWSRATATSFAATTSRRQAPARAAPAGFLAAGAPASRASELHTLFFRPTAPDSRCFEIIRELMPLDTFGRPLRNLRISVTDRCNLRCSYCMPEAEYVWLPREDILSFEEIVQLADIFLDLGVDHIRLTGGEPLLRRDLPLLVAPLAARPGVRDLA